MTPKPAGPASESLSILIVDSDPAGRQVLKSRLAADPGWTVSFGEAQDGETALLRLKERSYDLIFLACRGSDELPLLARMRQLHAKSAVVAVCRQSDAAFAVEAMKAGALDCLVHDQLARADLSPILRRLAQTRALITQNLELRQVNQMKNEFIANVSHELRSPLAVILGYAHALQEGTLGTLNEEQRKAVGSIAHRSDELLSTLNRILRVRESVEGLQLAELKPTDLRGVWRAAVERGAQDLRRKNLRLECAYPPEPVWVLADLAALGEVCDNLLSNAAKFSPGGGLIRLTVGVAGGRAACALQDQGQGIPPELLSRVFEDFSTARVSGPTRQSSGLGLGLALCRQAVELHSGSIWLESAGPGRGCTAHITLPLARPDGKLARVEAPVLVEKRRILIVEDNPDLIDIIQLFISGVSANLELAAARSGFEALESIKNQMPHLIVMDIMMPGMTGLELLERLRRAPDAARIPVLVLTGYADAAAQARAAGAQDVLLKPFDRNAFVSRVLALLHGAQAGESRK
ncbi:MAG: response regulator [Elusimicrobia bacterium]|nr:response regulator [Elusimicrobiota bacterium]